MGRRSDHSRAELTEMALKAAREIIRKDGVSALSTRRLARQIGYTSGMLYQIFRNRDDLVEQVNIGTLAMLYDHCRTDPRDLSVQIRLRRLADDFVSFATAHPNEWDAVINYPFSPDHQTSQVAHNQTDQLLALLCDAISELYEPEQADRKQRDVRLLWNCLYGIFALASAGRLTQDRSHGAAVDDLIDLYLAART
ncbi:MAG: TetR/AcrR family transcriptional regulator [Pseudomonadota bacterium]